ncbi:MULTISPECIES: glycosyl transferase family 2 [Brevibacterium]|uniref:Glycosyl transferase family 2 n=2 Tax=Brevibacterium casei TaxID=33889 RepID=K9B353_9MICO|nr:glycosyl transferase family 2 [Brevibacterium casei]EKU49242.1 glycosyl transferase family 2 [Brevibacterium casei S18]QPR40017.1 glycosyl transferase [Brevibacterium casei]QPR44181.1 glycosyl transferase [Brevibacterium casei]SMX91429.1 Glycosyltransferase, GT2 family [Brevibacterium casei CIP 102111]
MRPAVTVVVSGDDSRRAELETALHRIHPEIPVVDLGGLTVTEALALPAVSGSEYLWFLTPDSRPEPGCLDELVEAISATESIAAVGPKLMASDRIVSAGVTTTSAGERVNPVGTGEVDQGQRDGVGETLALDLPGMLIATAELSRVGAPSRVLGPAYRGIEFSRRFRDLGKRVVVAPRARLEVSAAEAAQLGSSARPPRSSGQIRSEQRYRLSLARPGLPALVLGLALTRIGRALLALLGNDPRTARWHFSALLGLPSDVRATGRLRRANGKRGRLGRRANSAHLSALYADSDELAVQRRSMVEGTASGVGVDDVRDEADLHQVGDTEEAIDSFSRLEVSGGAGIFTHPLTYLILVSGVLSGIVSHRLFGPGHLVGGALGSTDVGYGELIARLLGGRLDVGTGTDVPADPLQLVLAVLGLPFLGDLDLTVRVLILLAPVGAAIAAYAAAGMLVHGRWVRGLAGLLWVTAPLFLTGLSAGRLGVIVVWIAAPLFVIALTRSLRTGSVSAAAGAGLLLFVLIAGSPLLLVIGLVLTVVLLATRQGLRHLWLLAPTLVLAWPWLLGVITEPGTLLVTPGQTLAPGAPPTYLLAVGFPAPLDLGWLGAAADALGLSSAAAATVGLWAPAVVVPMLVLAFLTLIEARIPLPVLTWTVGLYLAGLALATLQVHLPAQVGPFALIGSYPAAGLTLTSLGAIALLALGADRLAAGSRGRSRAPMRVLTGLVVLAALGFAMLGVGPAFTSNDTVATAEHGTVPALAADRGAGDTEARTLRLDAVDGEVIATLISTADGTALGTSTVLSAEAVGGPPGQRRPLPIGEDKVLIAQAAAALSADDAGDVRDLLGRLGVDFVLVGSGEDGLRSSVAAATGLVEVGPTETGTLWQVDKPYSGRFLIAEPDGTLSTAPIVDGRIEVPAGAEGRTLIVAENAPDLEAAIGDQTLPRPAEPSAAWDAEFSLPAAGGTVDLDEGSPLVSAGVIAGWVLGLVCLIVALPIGTRRTGGHRPRAGGRGGEARSSDRDGQTRDEETRDEEAHDGGTLSQAETGGTDTGRAGDPDAAETADSSDAGRPADSEERPNRSAATHSRTLTRERP